MDCVRNRKVELVQNEFVILKADQSSRKTHLGRFDGQRIVPAEVQEKSSLRRDTQKCGAVFPAGSSDGRSG